MTQWGALEDHLARCPRCRAAEEADRALGSMLRAHTGLPDPGAAQCFDNRVLVALRATRTRTSAAALSPLACWQRGIRDCCRALPLSFLRQLAGGALVAASVTALLLLSALHPAGSSAMKAEDASARGAISATRNEPPVPLESLLRSPSPRAALLWSTPSVRQSGLFAPRRSLPAANVPAIHPPARRTQVPASYHGELLDNMARS
jgi:hypothetical protein